MFRRQLAERLRTLPFELVPLLPAGFQRVGTLVLLRLDPQLAAYEREIGLAIRELLSATGVFVREGVIGELRTPAVRRIAGYEDVTVHKENGCLFKIDVTKVLFAKGNAAERGRIIADPGEQVVDMFAGIGYFSLGIAKRTPSCRVTAIEKNPDAAALLRENVELNGLDNVTVIEGDCREVQAAGDRVVMGYFPGTEAYLPAAFGFLHRTGTIHYHNRYAQQDLWRKPLGELQATGVACGFQIEVLDKRVVKSLSPSKVHVVVDARARKL